jgi:hypothetical protein
LAGCNQPARQQANDAKQDVPQWIVVPASTSPYTAGNPNNSPLYSAWRVNTKTGALEICYYDPGGTVIGATVTPEKLTCSKPVEASSPSRP